jgi:hypothetical protein
MKVGSSSKKKGTTSSQTVPAILIAHGFLCVFDPIFSR